MTLKKYAVSRCLLQSRKRKKHKKSLAHWEFVARFISKLKKPYFCKDLTFSGTSGLKRHQKPHKSLKKTAKGCKGHFKGQRIKKWKNIDFIAFLCSFGVKNEEDSVF